MTFFSLEQMEHRINRFLEIDGGESMGNIRVFFVEGIRRAKEGKDGGYLSFLNVSLFFPSAPFFTLAPAVQFLPLYMAIMPQHYITTLSHFHNHVSSSSLNSELSNLHQ